MKIAPTHAGRFQAILERKAAELAQVFRSEMASQSRRSQTEWLIQYAPEGSGDSTGMEVSFVSLRHSSFP